MECSESESESEVIVRLSGRMATIEYVVCETRRNGRVSSTRFLKCQMPLFKSININLVPSLAITRLDRISPHFLARFD